MLALATDADACSLTSHRAESGTDQIGLPAGRYRLPERARSVQLAAMLVHGPPRSGQPLLAPTDEAWVSAPRLAHMIGRGAALAGIAPPKAARPVHGHRPANPFAADVARRVSVTEQRRNVLDDPRTDT